jgi:hypothetical protein
VLSARPVQQAPADELQAAATSLRAEISTLDAMIGAQASPDAQALNELTTTAQALASQLAAADATAAADLKSLEQPVPAAATTPPATDDAQARLDRRKAELLKILDTVAARNPANDIQERTRALRAQIEGLTPAAPDAAQESGPLLERLAALDDVLSTVKAIPDPGVQSQLAQVEVLRAYGQQRISAGLSAADFETRKSELLGLLDAIERRGGPAVRGRVGPLRQRVLALRPGSIGDGDLARNRRLRQRQLDRVQLELELAQAPDESEPAPTQDARIDPEAIEATLQRLRAQLTDLERTPRMSAAQSAEDREQRRNELDAAEPVMPRSIFNHAPHTTQTQCDTCHASTRTSKLATDINVPGVANCTTCHAPSRTRSDCETCHIYHPRSAAQLLMVRR